VTHVVLTFWGVPPAAVPAALARMVADRRHLRSADGLTFAKLLGTGDGRTFTVRDADPLRWGLLTVWQDPAAADAFRAGPTHRAWSRLCTERLELTLRPVASRGRWSRREPFGDPVPTRTGPGQPVAAITRARLRPGRARRFWRAVPPVATDLRQVPGLHLAVGIGEAPIGLQGTFSLWQDGRALTEFTHRRAPHAQVAARTAQEGWYAEELFARFAVLDARGTFAGIEPLTRAGQGRAEQG